jgi:hypothetical protein
MTGALQAATSGVFLFYGSPAQLGLISARAMTVTENAICYRFRPASASWASAYFTRNWHSVGANGKPDAATPMRVKSPYIPVSQAVAVNYENLMAVVSATGVLPYILINDSGAGTWQVLIDNNKILWTSPSPAASPSTVTLTDYTSGTTSWQLGITTSGTLTTTSETFNPAYPVGIALISPNGSFYALGVDSNGLLNTFAAPPPTFGVPYEVYRNFAYKNRSQGWIT